MESINVFDENSSCPSCGREQSKDCICFNSCCELNGYSFNEELAGQLNNNIWTANTSVEALKLSYKPKFYILGGVALHFHGLNYNYTLDIDTANTIDDSIKNAINGMLDDNAQEVAVLGANYKSRAIRILNHLSSIEVYLLGIEDLLISKLNTYRRKDETAILNSGLLKSSNLEKVIGILNTEVECNISTLCKTELKYLINSLNK